MNRYILLEHSQDGTDTIKDGDSVLDLSAGHYTDFGLSYSVYDNVDKKTVWRSEEKKYKEITIKVPI